jgi:hypothetical protein
MAVSSIVNRKLKISLDTLCPTQFFIISVVFSFACFAVRSRIMKTDYARGQHH